MVVADALRLLPGEVQQHPRRLEAAHGHDEDPRPHGDAGVALDIALEEPALHGGEVGGEVEVDEIGVQHAGDARIGGERVGIFLAEAGRRAVQELDAAQPVLRLHHRQVGGHLRPGEVEDVGGLGLVGVEVGLGDRPGARPHGRGAEGLGVDRPAAPRPVARTAAEGADADRVEVPVAEADDVALVELLGFVGDLQPARLHQRHAVAEGREPARQGDPRGAGTGDADVEDRIEDAAVVGIEVKEHDGRFLLRRKRSRKRPRDRPRARQGRRRSAPSR